MTTEVSQAAPLLSHLEAELGLSFAGPRRARLLAAIDADRAASGMSAEEYLDAVSRPGPSFDRLVAEVTVGETYFFRDRLQCDLLRDVVLPELAAQPQQRVVVWSAGCASGEEAYTVVALADEAGLGERVSVVGSDVSARALARAERGVYRSWSMRATTPHERAAHFHERDGAHEVNARLRRRVRFVQRNLLDGPPPPGRFDVVLCRNLLIYLTREAVQQAAAVLADALAPRGWLITGAGDPPLQAPGLESVRTKFGLAYRRSEATAGVEAAAGPGLLAVGPAPAPGAPAAPGRPRTGRAARQRPPRAATPGARRPAPARARPDGQSPGQVGPTAPPSPPSPAAVAERIRALGDAGRLVEACDTALAAVQAQPLDVELRYLAGVVLLEAGRLDDAAGAASSAVYLGPNLPAAHLLLGQVEHARGNVDRARRSFRTASRLLAAAPADAPVALAGDVPAGHLATITERYLAAHGGGR